MPAITTIAINTTHDATTITIGPRGSRRVSVAGDGADGTSELTGTLSFIMFSSVTSSSILLGSATSTSVRAIVVIALAFLALWIADRMKPATPRRPVTLQVDQSAAPLYREPDAENRRNAALRLGVGAVAVGAIAACVIGVAATLALEILGRLLRG